MKGKKLILLAMAIMLLLAIPTVALAVESDAKSNTSPPTIIRAQFEFNITGVDELTITGKATGLSPTKKYHSAVYGFGGTIKGVNACKGADPVGGSMFAGNWSAVTPNGKATLSHVTDADLDKIFTISVRRGAGPGTAGGPGSTNVVLVCGEVEVDND